MSRHPSNREAAGLIAGFALWSLAFAVLYGAHGAICATGVLGEAGGRILLIGLWAVMIAGLAALITWLVRQLRTAQPALHFIRLVSLALAVAALGATAWIGIPALILSIC